jgi:RNA polymerase sigma-32 factor
MSQSQALTIPFNFPAGSEESYVRAVNQIPLLDAEEERVLARRLRDEGDLYAARRLILAHLRFVVRIARGYSGYGLAQSDLIQEGNIGLMKAVRRFDPDLGVRLVSFAVHWIRAEIHEFILRNWRIVKVATTKAQRKLFFNLRSAKKRLGWMKSEEVDRLANDLGVSREEVLRMEERLNATDASYDAHVVEGEEEGYAPVHYLEDRRFEPEALLTEAESESGQLEGLTNALATLDPRSRDIVVSRWLREPKKTLHELAARYDVSAERVRQLEQRALEKLKGVLATPLLAAP